MKKLFAALLFVLASSANAGVTYTWRTVLADSGHQPFDIQMDIVFSAEAVRSGSVDFLAVGCDHPSPCNDRDQVLSFYFSGGTQRDIYFSPSPNFADEDFILLGVRGIFSGARFIGDVFARTTQTEVVIYNGDVWFLESTISGDICNLGEECAGEIGIIQAVPEPSTIALLGLSLAGLALARRRSKFVSIARSLQ